MTSPQDGQPDVFVLDQAVINAGRELVAALMADPPDPDAVDMARQTLLSARADRWGAQ